MAVSSDKIRILVGNGSSYDQRAVGSRRKTRKPFRKQLYFYFNPKRS